MKRVTKGGPPHGYREWCKKVRGTNKEDYREMPSAIRAVLVHALVKEQGELCAYTMRRIGVGGSHVEHIKPEKLCRSEKAGADLSFDNMVACFPRDGMQAPCRYGAQKKGGWWDASLFVSPLGAACEQRFRFNLDGAIESVGANGSARTTINVLALNHPSLVEDRRRSMKELLYGKFGSDPLSEAKARQLQETICKQVGGRFVEFCVALRDALDKHIKSVRKVARQRKFAKGEKG